MLRLERWIAPFIKQGWFGVAEEVSILWVGLWCALPSPFQRTSGREKGKVQVSSALGSEENSAQL